MKSKIVFVLFFVALTTSQVNSLSSIDKDKLAKILLDVNDGINTVVGKLNDNFVESLKNETGIKQWSVNLQVAVLGGATKALVSGLEYVGKALEPTLSQDVQTLLKCFSLHGDEIVEDVRSIAATNGWCNNRLAANLTRTFQAVTQHVLEKNAVLRKYEVELQNCKLLNALCLTKFEAEFTVFVTAELGKNGILPLLQDVYAIYKIMFGEDIPRCLKEQGPAITEDVTNIVNSINSCAKKE